jgi:hypothetical protein
MILLSKASDSVVELFRIRMNREKLQLPLLERVLAGGRPLRGAA